MNIPPPQQRLAGCVWLPRILEKARLLERGALPPAYAERFCHSAGVDGLFLNHFGLCKEDILAMAQKPDAIAAEIFQSRAQGSAENIALWNDIATNLGRSGYPMAERFPIAKETVYKHIDSSGMTTVFEVLEADDKTT